MAEETPGANPEEDDVESEMLRMMQEEIAGEGGDAGGEDDAMAAMAAAMTDEPGEAGEGGSIDEMLEQEMLKAMQTDTEAAASGGGAMAPLTGGPAGVMEEPEGMERLVDVEVNVTVELGGTLIPIKDILSWSRDAVLELEQGENTPVDVLVNGKLFAKGEIVVVADVFGVRIIELVDQPEETHL